MRTEPGAPVQPAAARLSPKARILLPIALSVGALAIFLLLFLPSNHGHKGNKGSKSGNRSGNSAGYYEAEGNSPVTEGGKGGSGSSRPAAKGEKWWYQEKEAKSEAKGEQWWFQEKSGSKAREPRSTESPVGGS
jgi:hypothetical protein